MRICALLIQDDLAIMVEGTDGKYYFQGGAICVAGFWRMRDKIGLPLEEIHISGHVPRYTEKLETSMERFFRRMSVDKPVVRNNYFVQLVDPKAKKDNMDPEELAWSHTTNGPEDVFEHGNSAHPPVLPQATPETLRLRTERQTLRRLPGSGVIVFTIRTYVIPAVELGREIGVPGRLASALRSWPEDIARYKGARLYWDVLVEYMEKCSKEQAEEENSVEEKMRYPY
ncbi:hypothetical protein BD779DRAFT_1489091 [Infundibulicybe gibba]|nr:hypothetical protein BD779DRAFT_1489091 [Infundibulicybe gibba]